MNNSFKHILRILAVSVTSYGIFEMGQYESTSRSFFIQLSQLNRKMYLIPFDALSSLFYWNSNESVQSNADFFLAMCLGFVCFTFTFYTANWIIVKAIKNENHLKYLSLLWLWMGNLLFSQIEFFLSLGDRLSEFDRKRLISLSAVGFITLDLPTVVQYSSEASFGICSLLLWKSLAIFSVFFLSKIPFQPISCQRKFTPIDPIKMGFQVGFYGIGALGIIYLAKSFATNTIFADFTLTENNNSPKLLGLFLQSIVTHEAHGFLILARLKDSLSEPQQLMAALSMFSFINFTSFGLQCGALMVLARKGFLQTIKIVTWGFLLSLYVHIVMILPILCCYQ